MNLLSTAGLAPSILFWSQKSGGISFANCFFQIELYEIAMQYNSGIAMICIRIFTNEKHMGLVKLKKPPKGGEVIIMYFLFIQNFTFEYLF